MREVNLVKHSSTSPSISTATATSYPPPPSQQAPIPDPNWNPMLDTRAHPDAQRAQMDYYQQTYHYDRLRQQNQSAVHQNSQPSYPQNPQYPQSRMASNPNYSNPSSYSQSPQYAPTSQYGYSHTSPHTPTSQYGPGGHSLTSPTSSLHASMPPPGMSPTMFTRNLIGSLSASAFRLTDPENNSGIWFILQDLSVRTEGLFRYLPSPTPSLS
jgi:hypothetical protein